MRRQKILGFHVVTAFALLIGHGVATAQAQQGQAAPAALGSPDAVAGITRQVSLTPQEQQVQAEAILARMEGARSMVRQALEKARVQRDVVKTLCLNDKMNQLDVAIRSARERREALGAAAQRNDNDLSSHEFTILSVLRTRSDQLTAEANQCIGQEAGFDGDSDVKSTVEPGIVDIYDSAGAGAGSAPVQTDIYSEPPSCASCIK